MLFQPGEELCWCIITKEPLFEDGSQDDDDDGS
jgi:hypothetical protein